MAATVSSVSWAYEGYPPASQAPCLLRYQQWQCNPSQFRAWCASTELDDLPEAGGVAEGLRVYCLAGVSVDSSSAIVNMHAR
jgi:hypothetical protein